MICTWLQFQFEILHTPVTIILCSTLVFQSSGLSQAFAIYVKPADAATADITTATVTMTPLSLVKMLVDNATQEFQSNNMNNTISYLKGAEQELLSLTVVGNNDSTRDDYISTQSLTTLLLVKNAIYSLENHDTKQAHFYINLVEQELARDMFDASKAKTKVTTTTASPDNNFFTYTNTKYNIKLHYPHNWIVEADDYPTGAGGIQIVSFYLPDVHNGLPFFRIGTDDTYKEFPNLPKVSINQYLHRSLENKNSTGFPALKIIKYNANNRLASHTAYTILWTYNNPIYGMRKSQEIATIIGSRGYFVDYTSAAANFSSYLPIAEEMIKSLQFIK